MDFRNLLVSVSYPYKTDTALARAIELIRGSTSRSAAAITVLDVADQIPRALSVVGLEHSYIEQRTQALEAFVDQFRTAERPIRCAVQQGPVAQTVVEDVLRHKRDCVVRTTVPSPGIRFDRPGAVSQRLIRKCPVPVWILPPASSDPIARIAAAVDLTPGPGPQQRLLNERIVTLAKQLAELYGAELHVVYADESPSSDIWLAGSARPAALHKGISQATAEAREELSAFASTLLSDAPGAHTHLLEGSATESILEFVDQARADILVMGSVARTGLAGFLIGNTAERILQSVRCSVMTLKPDDFRCPVVLNEDDP